MELPHFVERHAPASVSHRLPSLAEATPGSFDTGSQYARSGHDPQTSARSVELGDQLTKGPKWRSALGALSGRERGEALDLLGFERQVVFSSFCARPILKANSHDLRHQTAAAHNRAMAEFCDHDERLLGVAMVPLTGSRTLQVRDHASFEHPLRLLVPPPQDPQRA